MDRAKTLLIYYAVLIAIKFTSGGNPCLTKKTQCICSNDRVDCSKRNITAIPSEFPLGTKQIYLNGNHITTLHRDSFQGLKDLITLNLFENNISYIESKTFSFMPVLEDIILNNNSIRELLPLTFLELESLYGIYLENNQISVIHPRAFEKLPKLERIYLAGNKLHCTCAIKWFVTYLNVNPILFNGTLASCSSPTTVEQKKVALLNTSNLQCEQQSKKTLEAKTSHQMNLIQYVLAGSLLALFVLLFTYAVLKGRKCTRAMSVCSTSNCNQDGLFPVVYTVDSQMETSTSDTFADNITYFSHNSGSFLYDNFGINEGYEPYGTDSICNRHSKHDYEIPEIVCQACKSTQTNLERRITV